MAKYINGSIKFPSALKPTGAQPLDDRTIVKTFNDLLDENTFIIDGASAAYPGMSVTVIDENKTYILKGVHPLDDNGVEKEDEWIVSNLKIAENWVPAGSSDLSGELADLITTVDKKIESVNVNGIDATVTKGAASVKIDADNIELGTAITSDGEVANEDESNVVHKADAKLSIVLQGIYDSISGAEAGGVSAIAAADKSILINSADKNNPTVRVQLSTNENNLLSVDGTGLFAAMYYEGDDE